MVKRKSEMVGHSPFPAGSPFPGAELKVETSEDEQDTNQRAKEGQLAPTASVIRQRKRE